MDEETRRKCLLDEAKIAQDIISRMANNSFLIKGWAVTLIVISLLFRGSYYHYFVAFIPLIIFWRYDAYFLRLEKLYRESYDWLIENRLKTDDCFLEFDRNKLEERFGKSIPCLTQVMFSKTIIVFYGFLFLMIVLWISLYPLMGG